MSPCLCSDSGITFGTEAYPHTHTHTHTHTRTHTHTHTHIQARFIHIIEQMASDTRLNSGELKIVSIFLLTIL